MFGGADIVGDVLAPVLGGLVGFVAARAAGHFLAKQDLISSDPRVGKTIAAAAGVPLVLALHKQPVIAKNTGAIILGLGLAASEAWLRDTPLLGGSPAAAALTEEEFLTTSEAMTLEPPPEATELPNGAPENGEQLVVEEETLAENGDGLSSYFQVAPNATGSYFQVPPTTGLGASSGMFAGHIFGGMT